MAKQKPLDASSRSAWVKKCAKIRRYELPMIETFLRGCPCCGVSARGYELAPLVTRNDSLCEQLLVELNNAGVLLEPERTNYSLATRLEDRNCSGAGFPRGNQQFVLYATSPASILQKYGLYTGLKAKEITTNMAAPYTNVLRLDGFFRHLRNSIAHGSYAECTRYIGGSSKRRGRYWFFQDANNVGSITARYFVWERTVDSWIDTVSNWRMGA